MMSKVKKALITAAVFIVVGISGSIVSGFYVVPQVAAEVYRVQKEVRNATPIEREVFTTGESVEALDISALNERGFDVEIKPSNDNNTRIKVYEYYENSLKVDANYDSASKKLVVIGERDIFELFNADSLKGFFERGYKALIGTLVEEANQISQIVIEVPTGVDISFKGQDSANLIVKDPVVLKDNLSFSCDYGDLDLPVNNNLKNIDIRTDYYFGIDVREFINAEKVSINSSNVYIASRGFRDDYVDFTKVPEQVDIFADKTTVTSFIPLGKNVTITSENVDYESNFEAYPVKLQLRGEYDSNAYYSDEVKGKEEEYISDGSYEGILGSKDSAEYNLTINRYYFCDIENVTDFEIESDLR